MPSRDSARAIVGDGAGFQRPAPRPEDSRQPGAGPQLLRFALDREPAGTPRSLASVPSDAVPLADPAASRIAAVHGQQPDGFQVQVLDRASVSVAHKVACGIGDDAASYGIELAQIDGSGRAELTCKWEDEVESRHLSVLAVLADGSLGESVETVLGPSWVDTTLRIVDSNGDGGAELLNLTWDNYWSEKHSGFVQVWHRGADGKFAP